MKATSESEPRKKAGRPKQLGRPRSDGRPPITRQDILRTASRLFADHGFAATSIKTIADGLQCHGTSIFNHFATKESILDELIEVTFGNELGLFEALTTLDAPPEVILHRLVYEDALACMGNEVTIRKVFLLPELRTERFEAARRYWDKNTDIYAQLIRRAISGGAFVDVPPKHAAEALYTLCTTGLVSLSQKKMAPAGKYAMMLADLALRGLIKTPNALERIKAASGALQVNWQAHKL